MQGNGHGHICFFPIAKTDHYKNERDHARQK